MNESAVRICIEVQCLKRFSRYNFLRLVEDGALDKSLGSVLEKVKPAVEADAAISVLSKGAELTKVIEEATGESNTLSLNNFKDVTADFLAPTVDEPTGLEECPFFVYKGLIRRLSGMCGRRENEHFGVLGGHEMKVLDVITGSSVESVLQNPHLIERWQSKGFSAMGVVVWRQGEPEDQKELIQALPSETPLLLMMYPLRPDRRAWVTQCADGALSFKPVSLDSKAMNRKKNDTYTVLPADRLSTSFEDQAASAVSDAVYQHVQKAVATQNDVKAHRQFQFHSLLLWVMLLPLRFGWTSVCAMVRGCSSPVRICC